MLKIKSEAAGGLGRIRCGAMGSPSEHHATAHVDDTSPPEQVVDGVSSRPLPLLMAAGLVAGAALGFTIRYIDSPWTKRQIVYLGFPGELFLRMMSGVTLPLISTSVVAALGSCRPPVLGRVGLCALTLSLACKFLAAAGALGLVAFLSPGNTVRLDVVETPRPSSSFSNVAIDRLLDLIRNLFPSNIVAAHIYTALTGDLSMYVMAFLAAVALHGLLVLPTLYLFLTHRQLGPFFRNMVYPLSVALGTSSSSATAPTLIMSMEQGLRMDPPLARFLAPVGATMNMDGTAIYFIVTVLFFAQKNNIAFTFGEHLVVGLMCCLATLNTSPSPQAGRVVLVYLMTSLGIPLDGIGILLYTDWIMNRLSTAVNVLGDAVVASGTQELCRATLPTGHDQE
ncbi:excitatory amino acid transporter 5-like isoform X2 [Rhipicephalus microplus]|uniref:excitatory amino acid transporter 5-like isoform X2 n=1 Tax=Rhipicephalus microplus TaxID=6941 RepID=UPI003F6C67C1